MVRIGRPTRLYCLARPINPHDIRQDAGQIAQPVRARLGLTNVGSTLLAEKY